MPKNQVYECPICHEQIVVFDNGAREVGHASTCPNK